MSEKKETLGYVIKKARHFKMMKQNELAKKIHVTHGYLSKIENDEKVPLRADVIKNIAKVLNIDYKYLISLALVTNFEKKINLYYKGKKSTWEKARKILLEDK